MYDERHIEDRMNRKSARALLAGIALRTECLSPRSVDKPLVLYGAGNLGRMAHAYFSFLGITVDLVVDANAACLRDDPFWAGTRLIVPEEVPEKIRGSALLALCVATAPNVPMVRDLAVSGWLDVVPFYDIAEFYRPRHPLSNGWYAPPLAESDTDKIATALDGWADDLSRAHHLQFIAWRRLREEWSFADAAVTTGDRYFIPEVLSAVGPHPRILDVGAHQGEVARRFVETFSGLEKLWMVEPDESSLESIETWLSTLDRDHEDKVDLFRCAVGGLSESRRFFSGLGYASQFSPQGQGLLETRTIDQLGLDPTYVKLHLEGWELDALSGATGTLERSRPIIAATLYHNALGLWETPLWLMRFLSGYRFYFRLHSWCGTGAVVYAVPDRGAQHG